MPVQQEIIQAGRNHIRGNTYQGFKSESINLFMGLAEKQVKHFREIINIGWRP
jgi:hypothetical protein